MPLNSETFHKAYSEGYCFIGDNALRCCTRKGQWVEELIQGRIRVGEDCLVMQLQSAP